MYNIAMDFSQITNDLFIGTTPEIPDYVRLVELGVRLVINMRFSRGPMVDSSASTRNLKFLWLRSIDSPIFVIPIRKMILGTAAALETIRDGGKVYSHCAAGRHRSVAMGAAILIAQGYSPETAMQLIKKQRPAADPDIFYIRGRILKFARQWPEIRVESV